MNMIAVKEQKFTASGITVKLSWRISKAAGNGLAQRFGETIPIVVCGIFHLLIKAIPSF